MSKPEPLVARVSTVPRFRRVGTGRRERLPLLGLAALGLVAGLLGPVAQAEEAADTHRAWQRVAKQVPLGGADGEVGYVLPAPDELVRFEPSLERQVTFSYSPLTGDVVYDEVAPADEALLFDGSVPLLRHYLALAADDAPVPAILLEKEDRMSSREKQAAMAGRRLTTEPLGLQEVAASLDLGEVGRSPTKATGSCTSAATFATNHCYYLNNVLIAPNRHDAIWCCDENWPSACGYDPEQGNTLWAELIRESSSARKNSYSATVACGADILVTHWFEFGGVWYTMDNRDVRVFDDQVRGLFVMGGAWYERRIHHDRIFGTGSGGLRGYSEFSNP